MTSGFGFGGGFGAQSSAQSPFGSTAPSPFGAPQSVFGQQTSSPFGSTPGTGLFGASTPAFGQTQTPAFGTPQSSSAFGTTSFGAKPATGSFGGFGNLSTGPSPFGASQPAFGAASTPAFGAASTPAFGAQQAAPAFGAAAPASPFGGGAPTFGTSTPAFGTVSSSGFGAASTPAFGSTGFGFGGQQAGFGAQQQQQQQGTRGITYNKVQEMEGGTGSGPQSSAKTAVQFCTILALPQFKEPHEKSAAELRWEDYQAGVKGNQGAPSAFGQQPNPFGTPGPSSPFVAASTPAFGASSSPAFGVASTPAYGQASAPAFGAGGFGQTSTFGSSSSTGLFGKPATPAFGQGSSPFGGSNFGQTPAFGQTSSVFGSSTPAFGQTQAAFGSTGFGSSFGSSTPAFGAASSTPAFGQTGSLFGQSQPFGSASPSPFGASSSSFSFPSSTPAFGQTGAAQPFGQTVSTGLNLGQPASQPSFGSNLFGNTASKPFGSSFTSSSPFGASSPSPFGSSTGGLFASTQTSSTFGTGLFGQQSGGSSLFSFATAPQQQQQVQQQMAPVQYPGISTSPYGTLPEAPRVNGSSSIVPEYKTGISQRPVGGLMSGRTPALMAPRAITPRSGLLLRPSSTRSRQSKSPADFFKEQSPANGLTSSPSQFVARSNPRQFFIRDPLPSTEAPATASPSPSFAATPRASDEDRNNDEAETSAQAGRSAPRGMERQQSRHAAKAEQNGSGRLVEDDEEPIEVADSRQQRQHQRHISDEEVSRLLPKVKAQNVRIEPGLTQLAAMAREDPDSLAAVANFKVSHRTYGSVQWREVVDVRGLDIDATVFFSKGSVEVYFDEGEKPEIGQGLNKSAEVTLLGVYKMDKATGQPTTDPAAIDKFIKRLKQTAASQNARFLEYSPEGGVWRFLVEHFSKYGLLNDSDEDEETSMTRGPPSRLGSSTGIDSRPQRPQSAGKQQAGPSSPAQADEADGMQEGDDDVAEAGFADAGSASDMSDDEYAPLGLSVQQSALSPILNLSLPANANLAPTQLARMRSSLYPAGEEPSQPAQKRRNVEVPVASASGKPPAPMGQNREKATEYILAPQAWQQTRAAILPPSQSAANESLLSEGQASGTKAVSVAGCLGQTADGQRNLVDASMLMGCSFRVGWGPNNTFVHAGVFRQGKVTLESKQASQLSLRSIRINRVLHPGGAAREGRAEADKDLMRQRWKALLKLHLTYSAPGDAPEGSIPQWSLRCTPDNLQNLCVDFLKCNDEFRLQAGIDIHSLEGLCLKHEMWTWQLLDVLYSSIQPISSGTGKLQNDDDDDDAEDDMQLGADFENVDQSELDRARSEMEAQLAGDGSLFRKIALLLSGQQLPAAAALASAAGNVRLACIILQAGTAATAREDIASQVRLWESAGFTGKIDAELLDIYRLLAGSAAPVTSLLGLDWRRAFAMHLWYTQPPQAQLSQSLESYTEATGRGAAPDPLPLYAEKLGWMADQARVPDIQYTLLQLRLRPESGADLSQLLSPEGYTPEPLDALLAWLLLGVLQAIGAVQLQAVAQVQVQRLLGNLVSQLRTVGGMPELEVYVALHLPECAHPLWHGSRDQLVRELLQRNAQHWAQSPVSLAFLHEELGLPQEWIADALATWARYTRDAPEELLQLLKAEHWGRAHELLFAQLAPNWFLQQPGQLPKLRQCVSQLALHAHEVDEELGYAAYRTRVGLYNSFFTLQEAYEDQAGSRNLLQETQAFCGQLGAAMHSSSKRATKPVFLQVCSKMAGAVASWLTSHGGSTPSEVFAQRRLTLQLAPLSPSARFIDLQSAASAPGLASA